MRYHLWDLTNENIELAVYEAVDHITSHDMANFFIRVLQPLLLINSLHYVLEAVFRCIFSEVTQHVY